VASYTSIVELLSHGMSVRVASERAEEIDLGAQLRQDDRGHPTPACGTRESALGVKHLTADRESLHRHEVHPLDMAHDRDARHWI
jgi:DNA-directed RNA polymerase subunit K/omega